MRRGVLFGFVEVVRIHAVRLRRLVGVASALVSGVTALVLAAGVPRAVASSGAPPGYWLVASDGGVFSFGGVPFAGSAGGVPLRQPVVAMAATPSGRGYWLVAADGGIFTYGDAGFAGSAAGLQRVSPVVTMAATPSGRGYWIGAANGDICAFGDAAFLGGVGARLLAPIVGMAPTPSGHGYWLVAADGGIFSFGDAPFYGSTGGTRLNQPVVGMAPTPSGHGYWLVAADGGIFSFGDAPFYGSTGGTRLNQPIVGMAATLSGTGYWLVAADGGVFAFGSAPFRGSAGGTRLARPIVGMAIGLSVDPYTPGSTGYDISWPQCGGRYPDVPFSMGIVGINDGRALTHNPCLSSERQWGQQGLLSAYINLNAPPPGDPASLDGPAGHCVGNDTGCMAYNFGYNAALNAYGYGTSQGVSAGVWWLDVEIGNTWDSNQFNNSRTIQGALDALSANGALAGIYSTSYQFGVIAGGYSPGVPIWVATGAGYQTAVAYCNPAHGFGGGHIFLTQYGDSTGFDRDYACSTSS